MKLKESVSEEKLNGRYFTPQAVSDFVTDWVLDQKNKVCSILEPSAGDGIFLKSLNKHGDVWENTDIFAIEINEDVSKCAADRSDQLSWVKGWNNIKDRRKVVVNDDFYRAYKNGLENKRFQAILGNPPYIRYQYLDAERREEQSLILTENGMKSNKLINAWVSFTVACVSCMDKSSRIGFVIPAELLQVKYSEDLRRFLASHLNRITILTFAGLVFEGIEQEVVLLLGEKIENDECHEMRIIQFEDLAQLKTATLDQRDFFEVDTESTKWTKYFLPDEELRQVQKAEHDPRFLKFSEVAKCEVGITTGNNEYFCLNDKTVSEYSLREYCKPLIARSVNMKGAQFTQADWQENIQSGARTYLLDLTPFSQMTFSDGLNKYIEYGEQNGQNISYKCQIREEWYKIPSVWSPDAFFQRRNHLFSKFTLNAELENTVSTDTMHRIRFWNKASGKRVVVAYYTSLSMLFSELEGRNYGGGVLEILPGEVGNIRLPNIFDENLVPDSEIECLFNKIDRYIRNKDDIIELLDMMDRAILVEKLGLEKEEVKLLKDAWITLRNRRLQRNGKMKS